MCAKGKTKPTEYIHTYIKTLSDRQEKREKKSPLLYKMAACTNRNGIWLHVAEPCCGVLCCVVGVCQAYMTCGYFVHNFIYVLIKWHIDDFISNNAHQIEAPSILHTFRSFHLCVYFIHSNANLSQHQQYFFFHDCISHLRFLFAIFFSFSFCRKAVKFNFIMSHLLNSTTFSMEFTHFIWDFMRNELSHAKRQRVAWISSFHAENDQNNLMMKGIILK